MATVKKSKSKRPDRSPKAAKPSKSSVSTRAKRDSSVAKKRLPQNDMARSETRVEIKPAKGRPMLTWVGKKPLRHAIAYPAQLVETFNTAPLSRGRGAGGEVGLLFHGDNKDVLAHLLANGYRGKVKLIYIDPPFDSGADYIRKVNLKGATNILEGEGYTVSEQVQYTDIWANDTYLQFIYQRLMLLKELLHEEGNILVHLDSRRNSHIRLILDEVFGSDNFVNEIIWQRTGAHNDAGRFGVVHDSIYCYKKSGKAVFNPIYISHSEEHLQTRFNQIEEDTGKRFFAGPITAPGAGPSRVFRGKLLTPPPGRHWSYSQDKIDELERNNLLYYSNTGIPYLKQYMDEYVEQGRRVQSIWVDLLPSKTGTEILGYPTQKPEGLLERVVSAFSNKDDIILDCFLGSGTTTAVAQKLGRRWIGADINKGAIQTTVKRLQGIIQEQFEDAQKVKQIEMPIPVDMRSMAVADSKREYKTSKDIQPAQLGFAVYRVNDYDLQIQHNEAFNLAVEHLGMTRSKTDAYFDGTLGKKLVKIVPFNHPVTPLDLEEVKRELNNRPDEERDIVVVGLGKEVAVNGWLEDWNKLRKQGNIPNKIEVIELRSDPKYGGFFTHEPAKAKVSFKRVKDSVEIVIDDFISPTILERLSQQNKDNPLFKPQVTDWRSMADSVMIDSAYDGKIFNITLADVPEKKNDLVDGKYVLEVKKGASVAVKVTDMLGEEVLVVKEV